MAGNGPQDRASAVKTQRVLELVAKGIPRSVIAERLGMNKRRVNQIIYDDRKAKTS